jgi:tetratricopeptide (TPR) repeat protein
MKRIFICFVSCIISITVFAQEELDKIVDEGVALHDKGDYTGAVKKYDEVLAKAPNHFMANYEKAYSLLSLKQYDESIAINKMLAEKFPDNRETKNVYANWGSALDDKGDAAEALNVYDKGIKAFPDFYLLYYNKAITYARQGDMTNSLKYAQDALSKKPTHASSHNLLGLLMKGQNNIASLLATLTFLALEPEGKRAEANMKQMEDILMAHVTKTGDNSVTINVSPDMLDEKKKGQENDFSSIELIITLGGALDQDKKYKKETKPERLERKLTDIISMMEETKKDQKGFFWDFYESFFSKMKSRKYLSTYSHVAYLSAGDKDNNKWAEDNSDKIKEFYDWVQGYKWSK